MGVSKASWCVIRMFCAASVACRRLIIDLTLHVASPSTRVHRSLDISSCCPARGRETVCVCARIADMVLDIGVGTVLRHTHACATHRMRHTHRMRRTHRTRHTHRMRHTHTRHTHCTRHAPFVFSVADPRDRFRPEPSLYVLGGDGDIDRQPPGRSHPRPAVRLTCAVLRPRETEAARTPHPSPATAPPAQDPYAERRMDIRLADADRLPPCRQRDWSVADRPEAPSDFPIRLAPPPAPRVVATCPLDPLSRSMRVRADPGHTAAG